MIQTIKRLVMRSGVLSLVGGLFLSAGLGLLGYGLLSTVEALQSRSWPSVQGMVTVARVGSYIDKDEDGSTVMYKALIQYTYQVDGRRYRGSRVSLGDYASSDPRSAAAIVQRYPAGGVARVYYNPAAPGEALLEPGFSPAQLILPGIGLSFSLAGVLLSFRLIRDLLAGGLAE